MDAARGPRLSNGRYMIAVKVSDIHCQPNKCLFMKTQILAHVSLKMIALMCGFSFFANVSFAQKKKFWKHLNVEINYGLNVNFFVRSYDELSGPAGSIYLLKKNLLGTITGADLKFTLNKMSGIGLAYSRSINKGTKFFQGNINGVEILVEDFQLRHVNGFYQAYYERNFSQKIPFLKFHAGILYARMSQQELVFDNWDNRISVQERNFKNSYLEEAGVFGGIEYSKLIDTKFEIGIKVRAYYLATANTFEAITLTPTLQYLF